MTFYIEHDSGQLASAGCTGQHDAKLVNSVHDAQQYETRAEAYDALQNFGPDWTIWDPDSLD